ncbi:hypothetical protein [Mucilaginibacter gynuensis]|uniref:hypothetical protein n=1 Tax=Mucilaginibacter gynuensis TaxID=1302236 RepID=UPI0031EF41C2
MNQALNYSCKIWLTTILVAPFLAILIDYIFNTNYIASNPGGFILGSIIFGGGMLSPISFICFYCAVKFLEGISSKIIFKKIILSFFGIAFTSAPFLLLHLFGSSNNSVVYISYCINVVLGIWVFNPEQKIYTIGAPSNFRL